MKKFVFALLIASVGPRFLVGDDYNPVGVTGAFEGVITTGSAYNVLNHNATRQIDDIVVPGAIGKYPLKMTRYYNSRRTPGYGVLGAGWTYEYSWGIGLYGGKIQYPNGNVSDSECFAPLAVSDAWQTGSPVCDQNGCRGDFRLADGGTLHLDDTNTYFQVRTIKDPFGQTTNLTYDTSGFLTRVTEPGGRYLQFNYTQVQVGNQHSPQYQQVLNEVDAYDGRGNQIDSVVYHYTSLPTGGSIVPAAVCLTSVDYSDSQHAYYSYATDNSPENSSIPCPCPLKLSPVLQTAQDVRYKGPMRQICYEYQAGGPHGAIIAERYSLNGSTNGPRVSWIDPPAPSPLSNPANFDTTYTEHRGDGPTRRFNYTPLQLGRSSGEHEECPTASLGPPQQFLLSYTDFQEHTTWLGYDTGAHNDKWYVNSVTDARGSGPGDPNHTTTYIRGDRPPAGIGEILRVTHPGGSHVDYTYDDHGHYVHTISNERQKVTTFTRDPTTHLVTRIDYPQDANTSPSFEAFTYNNFGQVLTHQLKNGASESFVYDRRGLLTDQYNPKQNGVPGGTDPHIHYDYYTSGYWTDRVQKMTLPANVTGNVAWEIYEYDRAFDGSGVTNLNGAVVAGRGLVTKITHADGKYKQFKYDAYGNKRWEDNELRKTTSYTYDDYNRLTSTTDPLQNADNVSYLKPGASSSYLHTTNSVYTFTSRAGIVTTNGYDENWRKTSSVVAPGTLNLTTGFAYDFVGNLIDLTDPRGKITHNRYDNRNRKTSTKEACNTPVEAHTVWHYDAASNINQIDRPDGIHETKGYDALNRMIWHTVPRQVPGPSPAPPINLTTHIAYNPSGTVQQVTDARGKIMSFQYNASDEKITMTYPLLPGQNQADKQRWVWDNAHNLASRTTVSSKIQKFDYDNRNRKTQMSWIPIGDWASFTYYDDSRLRVAQNPNSTITRSYDDAGHLTLDQQNVTGSAKSVNYPSYDDDGRLTNMNVGGASYDYTYSYDLAGRFEKIKLTSNGSVQFQYAYDPASNETDRYAYLPNSVNIQQHHYRDSLNRMASRVVKKNGTTFATEAYTYEHMNRITEVNRGGTANGFGYYWDGELLFAQYGGGAYAPYTEGQDPDLDTTDNIDPNAGYQPPEQEAPEPAPPPDDYSDPPVAGFVPPAIFGGRSVTYYLDRAGNRQQLTDSASPTTTYLTNNINQYRSVSGCSITNGLEHEVSDFQGPNDSGQVHYTYINDEHLKQVDDGTNYYYLYYDALGRCVKRNRNNNNALTTYYIYDGEKPIVEYNSSGTIIARNVYGKGIDEILMRKETGKNDGNWFYYAHDHEGSVTHLLDGRSTPSSQTGEVIERYTYDAFGTPTIYGGNWTQLSSTAYNNRFLFTGREYAATYRGNYVPAFTFYEYRTRAYNPILGRFMSEDPKLFDAGDYNLFRYCHNDPIDFTDPMGLDFLSSTQDFVTGAGDFISLGATAHIRDSLPGIYGFAGVNTNSTAYRFGEGTGLVLGMATGEGEAAVIRAGIRGAKQTANKVAAVIGKYPNYLKVADQMGAKRLNIPMQVWNKMTEAERWTATQKFLDRAIARGGDFVLDKPIKNISSVSGELRKELNYLSERRLQLSQDGSRMVKSPQFEASILKGTDDAGTHSRHIPLPELP